MYPNQNLPQLNNQIPQTFNQYNQNPVYSPNQFNTNNQLNQIDLKTGYIDPKYFDPANNPYLKNLQPIDEKLMKYLKPRPVQTNASFQQTNNYLSNYPQQTNYNPILNNNFAYAPVQNQFQQYSQPGYNQAYQNLYNSYVPISQQQLGYDPNYSSYLPNIDPSFLVPQQPLGTSDTSMVSYGGGSKESFHVASSEVSSESGTESSIEQVVEKQVEDKAEIEKKIVDLAEQLKQEALKMQKAKKQQDAVKIATIDTKVGGPINLKAKGAIERILKELSVYGYKPSQDVIKKMANTSEYDQLWENFKPNSSKAWMYAFFARMLMKKEVGK